MYACTMSRWSGVNRCFQWSHIRTVVHADTYRLWSGVLQGLIALPLAQAGQRRIMADTSPHSGTWSEGCTPPLSLPVPWSFDL